MSIDDRRPDPPRDPSRDHRRSPRPPRRAQPRSPTAPVPRAPDGPADGPAAGPDGPLRLRLRDPGELIAALPPMLGFRPEDSLVLVSQHGAGPRRRVGMVCRADLPASAGPERADEVAAVVAGCLGRVVAGRPEEVTLVVVGGGGAAEAEAPGPDLPAADVVEAASDALRAEGVAVHTRIRAPRVATGAPWRCYPPCDCAGAVGRVEDSPSAVASAWLGRVTYASRDELAATLAPDPAATSPRMRALVDAEHEAAVLDRELGGMGAARRDHAAVVAARAEVAAGRTLGDAEAARVAVALTDPLVRDTVMGWAVDPDPGVVAGAHALWTALVRAVPAPEVAEPAVLLAGTALVGGGAPALVTVALERARRADPAHRLTALVEALLAAGRAPEAMGEVMAQAGAESAARLGV